MNTGLYVVCGALALTLAGGFAWRRTNGLMRAPRRAGQSAAQAAAGPVLTTEQVGHELGERATLLQFSSAFCAPCRATRRILADVAAMAEGVSHIEVDAESHLDLVRELGVLRTPTVFVLAADGSIIRRASGQPRKPDVIAALGIALTGSGADAAAPRSSPSWGMP